MDSSDLVVTFDSSAGREAFAWGKKALFANYSGNPDRNCISPGPWLVEGGEYGKFESTLNLLREMTTDEYANISQTLRADLIRYDSHLPAHRLIRKYVTDMLGEN